jgi:glycosyltransferase involved in cell wall biosynthesis
MPGGTRGPHPAGASRDARHASWPPRPGVTQRPRLLQVVTLSEWGGAQVSVHALATGLRDRYDVTVACGAGGPLVARLRRDGIPVAEISTLVRAPSPLADARTLLRLTRWMRRARFDLVHCHSTKAGLLGRLAARLAGVPGIIFSAHGWPFADGWSGAVGSAAILGERSAARITSAIICVAERVRQEALRLGIGRPHQLRVIRNGIHPAPWLVDRTAAPVSRPDGCTVVAVGRLQRQKDPATLLAAWERVPRPHRLVLVGDGPLRARLEAVVRARGLSGRVRFAGASDDVPGHLRAADLFVLSSRWEGLPFAVIEAMMSGLPVVAADVGGVAEAVVDGETGLLVPPGDPVALAAAITRLLEDGAERRRMGVVAQRRALQEFTIAGMLARIEAVYLEALEAARRRGRRL